MTKIIIAEDEHVLANVFKRIITKCGHEVIGIAYTEKEILEQCSSLHPDIVFLDISIESKYSGIEICKTIKKLYPEIKVYFLTAYSKDVFKNELLNVSYDGYINKLDFSEKIPEILTCIKND
ncbi:MAG: response regulator [Candidatus Omnitrophica bacterium]|nr:response regulator [Candidatus Omnitrophota bacterium]